MKAGPRDVVEAGFLWLGFALFRAIGIESASALGGCLGRLAGRFAVSRNRIARRNIEESFPGITGDEVRRIVTGMWDNFGRLVAEFPHLHTIDVYGGTRVTVTRDPGLDEFVNLPAIFVGAHFGCFDLGTLLAIQKDVDLTIIYRQANNPLAERLIQSWRLKCGGTWAPKGHKGSQLVLKGIRRKGAIAVLADQKYSQGIAVPFFGREAKDRPGPRRTGAPERHSAHSHPRPAQAPGTLSRAPLPAPGNRQDRRCSQGRPRHAAGDQRNLRGLDPRTPRAVAVAPPPLGQLILVVPRTSPRTAHETPRWRGTREHHTLLLAWMRRQGASQRKPRATRG